MTSPEEATLLRTLERDEKLRRYAVDGDGNCQFRAIAYLQYKDVDAHDKVREEVVRHILNNNTPAMNNLLFEKEDRQKFCARMSDTSKPEWGNHETLIAAGDLYKKSITLFGESFKDTTEKRWNVYFNVHFEQWCLFYQEDHYDVLENIPHKPSFVRSSTTTNGVYETYTADEDSANLRIENYLRRGPLEKYSQRFDLMIKQGAQTMELKFFDKTRAIVGHTVLAVDTTHTDADECSIFFSTLIDGKIHVKTVKKASLQKTMITMDLHSITDIGSRKPRKQPKEENFKIPVRYLKRDGTYQFDTIFVSADAVIATISLDGDTPQDLDSFVKGDGQNTKYRFSKVQNFLKKAKNKIIELTDHYPQKVDTTAWKKNGDINDKDSMYLFRELKKIDETPYITCAMYTVARVDVDEKDDSRTREKTRWYKSIFADGETVAHAQDEARFNIENIRSTVEELRRRQEQKLNQDIALQNVLQTQTPIARDAQNQIDEKLIKEFFERDDNQWAIDAVRFIVKTKQKIIERLNVMQNKVVPSNFARTYAQYVRFLIHTDTILNELLGTSLSEALKQAKDFEKFNSHMKNFARTECLDGEFVKKMRLLYGTQDLDELVLHDVALFVTRSYGVDISRFWTHYKVYDGLRSDVLLRILRRKRVALSSLLTTVIYLRPTSREQITKIDEMSLQQKFNEMYEKLKVNNDSGFYKWLRRMSPISYEKKMLQVAAVHFRKNILFISDVAPSVTFHMSAFDPFFQPGRTRYDNHDWYVLHEGGKYYAAVEISTP